MDKLSVQAKLWGAGVFAILTGGAMYGLLIIIRRLRDMPGLFLPEIALTFLIIGNLVVLLMGLVTLALIFSALGVTDGRFALSFPEGTVRAIIALGLILIFVTTSVFLFSQLESTVTVDRVPASMVSQLGGQIMAMEPVDVQVKADGTEEVLSYNVQVVREVGEGKQDLAQTLTTTISTLVVAVAGFYFGTRAVQTAREAVAASEPVFHYLEPNQKPKPTQDEAWALTAHGTDFQLVKVMKLTKANSSDLVARAVSTNGAGTEIKGTFDFKPDTATGKWDLVVQFTDGAELLAREAFTLEDATAPA
ncbi:MAG: hypothetical protein KC418_24055 [Anaerolineales bacterium]|nr:hypothetical protein [Anaerolineales bacterium]MCB8951938.1 hypothetical protein [Ardenticatenales bacterium]